MGSESGKAHAIAISSRRRSGNRTVRVARAAGPSGTRAWRVSARNAGRSVASTGPQTTRQPDRRRTARPSTPVAQSWGRTTCRCSTSSPTRLVLSTETTSCSVKSPPVAAHHTLTPRLFATSSQASTPRSARRTRWTVSEKLPVSTTGDSGPGVPTRRSPVPVGNGSIRSSVSTTLTVSSARRRRAGRGAVAVTQHRRPASPRRRCRSSRAPSSRWRPGRGRRRRGAPGGRGRREWSAG